MKVGISIDRRNRLVVWRMAPEVARDLAAFIEQATSERDGARGDAAALLAAVHRLDPSRD